MLLYAIYIFYEEDEMARNHRLSATLVIALIAAISLTGPVNAYYDCSCYDRASYLSCTDGYDSGCSQIIGLYADVVDREVAFVGAPGWKKQSSKCGTTGFPFYVSCGAPLASVNDCVGEH
jgi:hypothetical protein